MGTGQRGQWGWGIGYFGCGEHVECCGTKSKGPSRRTREAFAVNVPLLYPAVEEHMASIVELGVPIVFTSAGNPRT